MGALEDDLDYGVKTYRESIVKHYNNNNGDIEKTYSLVKIDSPNQTRRMFDDNLKFLSDIGLLKEFNKKKAFNWTVFKPSKDKVFDQLQEELKVWQAHNFPNRQSFEPLLGIIEELGELEESKNVEDTKDAIGDCLVYITDYLNSMNITIKDLESNPYTYEGLSYINIQIILGKLAHSHLKLHQKIRMTEDHLGNIRECMNAIYAYLGHNHYDLETIVWQVWLKVRERDWQANRNGAHKI